MLFSGIETNEFFEELTTQPLPDGTRALCIIDKLKVVENEDYQKSLKLRFAVVEGELKDRKTTVTLHIEDSNLERRQKALQRFHALDKFAKGQLAECESLPDETGLCDALLDKFMNIEFGVWDLKDEAGKKMNGNRITGVYSSKHVFKEVEKADDEPF